MKHAVQSLYGLLHETYERWRADRAIRLGAALAYYAVFAAVPLLTSAIAIAGLVFSESEIEEFLIDGLESLVADVSVEVRAVVDDLAATIDRPSTSGGLAVISVAVGVFAASLLFVALQDSFNMIWKIPVQRGLRFSIRRRVMAFAVVLLTGAALVASLTVQTIALIVDEILGGSVGDLLDLNDIIVTLATGGLGVLAIAVLYMLLIHNRPSWRNALIAAVVTAVLMTVGTWAVGVYFSRVRATSLTGVSGGALIGLTWFYYLGQIVIGAAELLKTLEDRSAERLNAGRTERR